MAPSPDLRGYKKAQLNIGVFPKRSNLSLITSTVSGRFIAFSAIKAVSASTTRPSSSATLKLTDYLPLQLLPSEGYF